MRRPLALLALLALSSTGCLMGFVSEVRPRWSAEAWRVDGDEGASVVLVTRAADGGDAIGIADASIQLTLRVHDNAIHARLRNQASSPATLDADHVVLLRDGGEELPLVVKLERPHEVAPSTLAPGGSLDAWLSPRPCWHSESGRPQFGVRSCRLIADAETIAESGRDEARQLGGKLVGRWIEIELPVVASNIRRVYRVRLTVTDFVVVRRLYA